MHGGLLLLPEVPHTAILGHAYQLLGCGPGGRTCNGHVRADVLPHRGHEGPDFLARQCPSLPSVAVGQHFHFEVVPSRDTKLLFFLLVF